jgi:hypothetical protein
MEGLAQPRFVIRPSEGFGGQGAHFRSLSP